MYYVELHSGTPEAYVMKTDRLDMWPEGKRISSKVGKERLRETAIGQLREMLKPGDTVYCTLRNVSRSGMSRQIDFYANPYDSVTGRNEFRCISGLVADALDYPTTERGALKVGGCGMDMGFAVVYNLSRALYPDGFKCIGTKKRCPSNDHSNREHNKHHKDGGYALRHSWM